MPEFAGDVEATAQLVDLRDGDRAVAVVSRWRGRYTQALLVVDQFEELFTQNPPEEQAAFCRLASEAGRRRAMSMSCWRCGTTFCIDARRSIRCVRSSTDCCRSSSRPRGSLRRALVEPARRQGFAFEDDELPGEMVAEVEGERGALPMLAFAVARLWEKRDRERRLLTRQAYAEIGKVGGALAKHAEATLTSIGDERLPVVRELFRNLVTAEGTRAVREADELLSVFRRLNAIPHPRCCEGSSTPGS